MLNFAGEAGEAGKWLYSSIFGRGDGKVVAETMRVVM